MMQDFHLQSEKDKTEGKRSMKQTEWCPLHADGNGLQVRKNGLFRVISDMGRPREPEGTHAWAIFAREIWGLKLSVPIMIFTSNASAGLSKVGEKAPNVTARVLMSPEEGKPKANEVLITHSHEAAFVFCSFEGAS
jgi:hypothetical protein